MKEMGLKRLLFLGTGASAGVPMVGCNCAVCLSSDPKNKRLRPSALLEIENKKLLIDVGPDFRQQALLYGIAHIDGVLLTHAHYDHVAGLDELRAYYLRYKEATPVLCSIETLDDLKKKFDYLFKEKVEGTSLAAQLHFQVLENHFGQTQFLDVPVDYMTYQQGVMPVNGFRIGDFAYLTDVKEYSEALLAALEGVKVLVLNSLREKPSKMHLCVEEAVAFSRRVGATRSIFTHISHENDHQKINRTLPKECELGYDGLVLEWL